MAFWVPHVKAAGLWAGWLVTSVGWLLQDRAECGCSRSEQLVAEEQESWWMLEVAGAEQDSLRVLQMYDGQDQ